MFTEYDSRNRLFDCPNNDWESLGKIKTESNAIDMLEIKNLSVHYGARPILKDISLNAAKGEVLALIGPNGAGKSTLVKAVSGVIPLSHGRIQVKGQDVTRLSPHQRARQMAVVPQAVALPPAFTVWQTVLMGRSPYLGFLGQPSQNDEEITRQSLTNPPRTST